MRRSNVFATLFALIVIFMMILPFLLTFNEVVTKLVEKFQLYMAIQRFVVPAEVRMVSLLISFFGVKSLAHPNGFTVNGTFLEMTWNCVGWQSLLLLSITLFVGFKNGVYTWTSKIQALLIGLLGTFFVNIIRLFIIVLIFAYLRPIYGIVYHDYLAAITTVIWLFFFWWFCYKYVLVGKQGEGIRD